METHVSFGTHGFSDVFWLVDVCWVFVPTNILCVSHFDTCFLSWLVLQAQKHGAMSESNLGECRPAIGKWVKILVITAALWGSLSITICIFVHLSTFCVLCMYHMYVTDVETCWNVTFTTFYALWSRAISPDQDCSKLIQDVTHTILNFGWCFTIPFGHSSWWTLSLPHSERGGKTQPYKVT